ncbi:MAG: PilZ domain-containing protein [Lachnospiraceae bacterium]|nr:PilZ domain-containing protein [Lachnospiraceae bacterium]
MMDEMRKSKRTDLDAKIQLKLLKHGEEQLVDAEITNVSRGGVGFRTKDLLQLGECYQTQITLWTKEKVDTVIRIIRAEVNEDGSFIFGGTFVGMENPDTLRILIYQMLNDQE